MSFMRQCGEIWYSHMGHRWQYNMSHAHFIMGTQGYKRTLRICNTYCFFHVNNGYQNVPQYFTYTYNACFFLGGGQIRFINLPPPPRPQNSDDLNCFSRSRIPPAHYVLTYTQDKAHALAAINYFCHATVPQYRQTVILVEKSEPTRPIPFSPSG